MIIFNKLNKENISILHDALLCIKPSSNSFFGICFEISSKLVDSVGQGDLYTTLFEAAKELMQEWPNYSGDPSYPVSDKNSSLSPGDQYLSARINNKMWNSSTEYGRLRYNLLNFLIEQTNINRSN